MVKQKNCFDENGEEEADTNSTLEKFGSISFEELLKKESGMDDAGGCESRKIDWNMNSKNYKDILVAQTRRDSRAKIIKCHIDEAMGMSLATGIPIICEKRLYDCVAINCVLEQSMQKS